MALEDDLSGFGNGLLSGAKNLFGGGSADVDPNTGLSEQMRKQAMFNTFGNVGALLLAAGQKQMPTDRAKLLAQLGQASTGPQEMMLKQAQMYGQNQARIAQQKLLGVQTQQAQLGLDQAPALFDSTQAQRAATTKASELSAQNSQMTIDQQRALAASLNSPEVLQQVETWTPDAKAAGLAAIKSGNAKLFYELYEKMQPKFQNGSVYDPRTNTVSDPYSGTIHLGGGAAGTAPPAAAGGAVQGPPAPGQTMYRSLTEIPQDVTGDDFLKAAGGITPQMSQMALHAKRVIDGLDPMPTTGRNGMTATYNAALQNMVRRADPSYDFTDPMARAKTRTGFAAGQEARNITSFNTLIGHLGTLHQASQAMDNTDFLALNAAKNWLGTQTGGSNQTNFDTIKHAVADEAAKAFKGSNISEGEIKRWSESLNSAGSPKQLQDSISSLTELLHSRIEALGQQYTRGMGKATNGYELLDPKAQKTLDYIKGNPVGQAPATTGGGQATPAQSQYQEGQIATNRKTGERLIFRNGAWGAAQ